MAAVVFFLFSLYFMAFFQVWADNFNQGRHATLPDTGFLVLPHLQNHAISDVYVHVFWVLAIAAVAVCGVRGERQAAFRRMFWVLGALYILRGFTVSMTVLPNPYDGCEPRQHSRPFHTAFKIITGQYVSCGDVMYSGHTMILTSALYLVHVYLPWTVTRVVGWLLTLLGMLIIVSTRFHYTNDVLVAFVFTASAFVIYHFALDAASIYYFRRIRDGVALRCSAFSLLAEYIALLDGLDRLAVMKRFSPYCSSSVPVTSAPAPCFSVT